MLSFCLLRLPIVYPTVAWLALFATATANADDSNAVNKAPTASNSTVDDKFHIVGYLPEYRAAQIDPEVGKDVTDLVYFSAQIDASGHLQLAKLRPEHILKLQKIKQQYHTALSLCVGGWGRSDGFAKVAASDEARRTFAAALVKFCQDNQFDGADLDWEHPANEAEQRDYGILLTTIRQAFEPHHLQLTIAVAGWQGLTAEAIQAVDRVHLMAHDARGRHST
ncbi:MAG TPA: glycoside hydrolase family 18 protein, partial [Planctomycetaceae bacterium]